MLDKFDYAEPVCPLCDGKEFYYPDADAPLGRIPVGRILQKVDSFFDKNDYAEAGRLLRYWKQEAVDLKDKSGELAIESELVGFYRKQKDKENGLNSVNRALELVNELNQNELASGATVYINCATAYKEFNMPSEAMPLYNKAEQIYNKVLQKDDARFGGLYNNMAITLADLGNLKEAETAYFKALDVMKKAKNGENECAITYINLAHMYDNFNMKDKIDECMQKALSLLKSKNLEHNGYYAFVIEKCAPSFKYFGDNDTCEQLLKEAESIYARA